MKMDFSNRMDDSSSDDSDIIPPTPAAKSTPIVPSDRLRKQSSSSESSSNSNRNFHLTPKHAAPPSRAADSSSSSDEETSAFSRSNVKMENKSPEENNSSSDEEDNQEGNSVKNQVFSQLNQSRPVHAMSSSGSDDDDVGSTMVNKQISRQSDSSDESDNDDTRKIVPALPLSRQSSSSEESEDEETRQNLHAVPPSRQTDSSDSSDDEETRPNVPALLLKTEKPSTTASSDDESDGDTAHGTSNLVSTGKSNNRGDNEVANNKQQSRQQETSSEESENEEVGKKPLPGEADSGNTSSEDELQTASTFVGSNQSFHQEKDSSDEVSSEGDFKSSFKATSVPTNQQHDESSEEESSDDETNNKMIQLGSKPSLSAQRNQNQGESSEETSSENESRVMQNSTTPKPSSSTSHKEVSGNESSEGEHEQKLQHSVSSYVAARRNSSSESSDDEGHETEAKSRVFSGSRSESKNSSATSIDLRKPMPSLRKRGKTLLKESFKGKEPMQAANIPLALEDIGSDDEIWLLQCPKSMDVSKLKKQNINLSVDSDIQLEDGPTFKRFSITAEENSENSVSCLLPSRDAKVQISLLPIKGKVLIQEHVHVPKLRLPEASAKGPVPLPNCLKKRHPLLGIGYEEHIAEAQRALRQNAKHKKSKKSKSRSGFENPEEFNVTNMLYNSKHSLSSNSSLSNEKKKSKHKQKEDTLVNTEYQKNSANEDSGKKRRNHMPCNLDTTSNIVGNTSVDISFLNDASKKKHKKSKKDESSERHDNSSLQTGVNQQPSWHTPHVEKTPDRNEVNDDSSLAKKSKKKHKDDYLCAGSISTIQGVSQNGHFPSWHTPQVEETSTSVHVSEDSSSMKKNKKSKKESKLLPPSEIKQELDESVIVNGFLGTPNHDTSVSKKRKRKEGYESGNSLEQAQTSSKKKKYSM